MAEQTSPSDVNKALMRLRDVLASDFGPENHPELNIQRVTDFLHEIKVTPVPMAILTPKQIPEFYVLLKRGGFGYSPKDFSGFEAQFFPELRMMAIYRDPDSEAINGSPIVTEGNIIHEQCHADEGLSAKVPFTRWQDSEGHSIFKKRRSGFTVGSINAKATGSFLEEGYADVYRGYYVARYAPESYWQNLASHLRVSRLTPKSRLSLTTTSGDTVQLAAKYACLFRDKRGNIKVSYNPSSLPATALELLVRHDSELKGMLFDARYNVQSYRLLIKRLNSHDELYSKLSRLSYNHDDFFTGLKMVSNHVATSH